MLNGFVLIFMPKINRAVAKHAPPHVPERDWTNPLSIDYGDFNCIEM